MTSDTSELVRRIRLGEDSGLELKNVRVEGSRVRSPHRDGLADELAALANGRGGTLVLGVGDETREVEGIALADLDAVEGWVRDICNDLIKPALNADILKIELANAEGIPTPVLCVEVPRSLFVQESPGGYFEALVNAVAHRDYSMTGMRIRLHLFNDRLELSVPGALANTLTPDSLHLRQASRNELVVSLLARCPAPTGLGRTRMMDRRGDGVPIILKECRELSGKPPTYSLIDDAELRLVMWA